MAARKGTNRYPRSGERIVPTVLREFLTAPVPGHFLAGSVPKNSSPGGKELRFCDLDEGVWQQFSATAVKELSRLVVGRVAACKTGKNFQWRRFPRPAKGVRLEDLHLENRTRRCLQQGGFEDDPRRLGDHSLSEILAIEAFGPRCLVDLLSALEASRPVEKGAAPARLSPQLSEEASRLSRLSKTIDVHCDDPRFGDLIKELDVDVLSVGELAERLLGREVDPPDPRYTSTRVRCLRKAVEAMFDLTLEAELTGIFGPATHQRNRDILVAYHGWRDGRQRTLAEVGKRFGITRERVRQVCAKLTRCHQDVATIAAPVMDSALRLIDKRVPCSLSSIEAELADRGMTSTGMTLEAVLRGARLLGRPVDLKIAEVGSDKMAVRPEQLNASMAIAELARKEAYFRGPSTVDSISRIVSRKLPGGVGLALVRETLPLMEGFRWLDEKSGWFRLCPISKHGLPKVVDKVLSVAGEIRVGELLVAISRSRRMWDEPPPHVLLEFCRQLPGVRVEGSRIIADPPRDWRKFLTGIEATLVEVLREHGPIMDRGAMEDLCVAAGMNRFSFHAFLSWSPVITQFGNSVYGLSGTKVSKRELDKLLVSRLAERSPHRVLDGHGYTEDGKVWLSYCLSKAASTYAVITIPMALKNIVKGQFALLSDDGEPMGTLATRDGCAWGLGSLMRQRKARVGDRIVVTLDLEERTATVTMGEEIPT
jgi:hypothetical protein